MTPQQIINETCRCRGTSWQEAFVEKRTFSRCVIARQETWIALYMQGWSTHGVAALTQSGQSGVWRSLKRAGVDIKAIQHEWTDREIALLGTGPDNLVCDEINLYASRNIPGFHKRSRVACVMKRNKLGIPAYRDKLKVSEQARRDSRRMRPAEWCKAYGFHRSTYYATRKK